MKKLVVTALTMALILCSCGEMKNISFSEMSAEMKNASGRELTDKDIKEDDCYIIGISEKTYKSRVESAAVFSAVKGAAVISPQAQPFPSPGRLTARLKCCPPSVQSTNILPISRHIPIPMLRFLIWSGFSRKPFPIQGLWRFPSAPVQTAWERM